MRLHIGFSGLPARTHLTVLLTAGVLLPVSAQADAGASAREAPVVQRGTAVGALLAAQGGLLVRDFYEVGGVAGEGRVEVRAVVFTPPGRDAAQVRGLRVEVTAPGKPESSAGAYVDVDELESLSSGLTYMLDLAARWKGEGRPEYTEVDFSTRDHVRIGFYQQRKRQGAFVSAGGVQVFLDTKDLGRMKALVDDGFRMLKGQ